jgi:molybdate transport system substrate-binding protein
MQSLGHLRLGVSLVYFLVVTATATAAEVKVLSDSPLAPALEPIAEAFRRDSGHEVKLVFGLSPVIHKRVIDGETADVIIIQPNFMDELVKTGRVTAGEHPVIARVGVGLFMRADATAPDISTVPSFRQALLSADALVFNNVASGNYFATVLERLGIADAVKPKVVRISPAEVIGRIVQSAGSDIGVYPVTLIVTDKRLKLIGTLPAEMQSYLVYAAPAASNAPSAEAGTAFIKFLGSPASKAILVAAGAN